MQMSPEPMNLDALLAPLSDDAPTGANLRADLSPGSPYFRLRDARAEARDAERRTDNDPASASMADAHWSQVREIATAAIASQSKDIEIAAWLTESLVRRDGLAGFTAGVRLMRGLVESYWTAGLHPLPDEDGVEARCLPIGGLNGHGTDGTLAQPLRKVIVLRRNDGVPVSFWMFEQSEDTHAMGDAARKQQRLASGVIPFEALEQDAATTGNAEVAQLGRDAGEAVAEWRLLTAALDSAAGAAAPPMRRLEELLDKIRRSASRYAPEATPAAADEAGAGVGAPEENEAAAAKAGPSGLHSAPVTREAMLQELAKIAQFFRRTEPTSPLAYTLDDAVRRAGLSWPDLLAELVPETQAQHAILSSLGIKPKTS